MKTKIVRKKKKSRYSSLKKRFDASCKLKKKMSLSNATIYYSLKRNKMHYALITLFLLPHLKLTM